MSTPSREVSTSRQQHRHNGSILVEVIVKVNASSYMYVYILQQKKKFLHDLYRHNIYVDT